MAHKKVKLTKKQLEIIKDVSLSRNDAAKLSGLSVGVIGSNRARLGIVRPRKGYPRTVRGKYNMDFKDDLPVPVFVKKSNPPVPNYDFLTRLALGI